VVLLSTEIEGLRVSDLKSGTSSAKTVTLQFGCKGPAGTYCCSIRNNPAYNRTIAADFTIAAGEANTDVVKSITMTLDTTGTWPSDNASALEVSWALAAGSGQQVTAAGVWQAGAQTGTANISNFMGTNGNVFELFDVGLYEGNVAPPFMVPDYASELLACQRYFRFIGFGMVGQAEATTLILFSYINGLPLRAIPTATTNVSSVSVRRHSIGTDIVFTIASTADAICSITGGRWAITISGSVTVGETFISQSDNVLKLSARL
jgi:hypothetical protein